MSRRRGSSNSGASHAGIGRQFSLTLRVLWRRWLHYLVARQLPEVPSTLALDPYHVAWRSAGARRLFAWTAASQAAGSGKQAEEKPLNTREAMQEEIKRKVNGSRGSDRLVPPHALAMNGVRPLSRARSPGWRVSGTASGDGALSADEFARANGSRYRGT